MSIDSVIPAETLAAARAALRSLMTTALTIRSTPTVGDGMGGQQRGDPVTVSAVGYIGPVGRTPEEIAVADRLAGRSLWTIALPVGTVVAAGDRIVAGERTFEVIKPLDASFAFDLPVICIEE